MSKSKVAVATSGKARKKGKKGRKVGKGIHKLSHSKWGNYAALIAHQKSRRLGTLGRRFCKGCDTQLHSRAAFLRYVCKIS